MAVGASALTAERFHCAVPPGFLEIDVGTRLVVFPAGSAYSVFFCVLHQGLPILHVLCYTVHERWGTSFQRMLCGNSILTDVLSSFSFLFPHCPISIVSLQYHSAVNVKKLLTNSVISCILYYTAWKCGNGHDTAAVDQTRFGDSFWAHKFQFTGQT